MYQLGKDDIALMFFCGEDKDGKWNGCYEIKMYCDYANKFGTDHVDNMKRLMGLVTTCVHLMAEDDNFRLTVHDEYEKREKAFHEQRVHNVMDKHDELESKVKSDPKIISRKGNIIKVDWGQI